MRFLFPAALFLAALTLATSQASGNTNDASRKRVDPAFSRPAGSMRPLAGSDLSLGDFARLVNYAYISPEQIAVSDATMERIEVLLKFYQNQFEWSLRNNGKVTEGYAESIPLLKMALTSEAKAQEKRHQQLSWKTHFLAERGFRPAPLAGLDKALAAFPIAKRSKTRVELYHREGEDNLYLVFSHRETWSDWLLPYLSKEAARIKDTVQYTLADQVMRLVKKQYPKAPLVLLGHGQGGAIAQYVGNRTGDPVVGFNVAGVENAQLKSAGLKRNNNILLFSAVYRSIVSDKYIPDPVSIHKLVSAQSHLSNTFADTTRLNQPHCLFAKPEPFITQEQDEAMAVDVALILARFSIGNSAAVWATIKSIVAFRIMKDGIWDHAHASVDPYLIKQHADTLLSAQALRATKNIKAAVGAFNTGRDLIKLDFWSMTKSAAMATAATAALWKVKQDVMAHDMSRFVEGLDSFSAADIHLHNIDDGAHPWLAQCKPLQAALVFPQIPEAEIPATTTSSPAQAPQAASPTAPAQLPQVDNPAIQPETTSPSKTPVSNTSAARPAPSAGGDATANQRASTPGQNDERPQRPGPTVDTSPQPEPPRLTEPTQSQTETAATDNPVANTPTREDARQIAPAKAPAGSPGCVASDLAGRWQGQYTQGDKNVPFDLEMHPADPGPITGLSTEADSRPLRWGEVKADWTGAIGDGLFRFQKRYQVDPSFFSEYLGSCEASGRRIAGQWRIPGSKHQGRFELIKQTPAQ